MTIVSSKKGFSLPTVLISSVVMLMILVTVVSATSSIRSSLQNQHFTDMARAAADAGTVFADACLRMSDNEVTWSNAQPLKPDTNCKGEVQGSLSAYLQETDDYRTYFVVNEPKMDSNDAPVEAASQGYVEALRASTGLAWQIFSGSSVRALSVPVDTPVGTSIEGYWSTAPEGYLLEDGSAVSRSTYAKLFAAIGTTFGSGNGSTTFNLPDSRGRVAVNMSSDTEFNAIGKKSGGKTHTHSTPSHTHSIPTHTHTVSSHTHSIPAHTHALGNNAYALIRMNPSGNGIIGTRVTGKPSWTAQSRITSSQAQVTTSGTAYTEGTPLRGNTNSSGSQTTNGSGTLTTSSSGSGSTGSSGGTTGSTSNVQPSITVMRAIKY